MSRHQKYIELAVQAARTSKCRFKVGAVLVNHGQVTVISPNIRLQSVYNDNFRHASLHAEESVLRRRLASKGK